MEELDSRVVWLHETGLEHKSISCRLLKFQYPLFYTGFLAMYTSEQPLNLWQNLLMHIAPQLQLRLLMLCRQNKMNHSSCKMILMQVMSLQSTDYTGYPLQACFCSSRWPLLARYWPKVVHSVPCTTGSCKTMFPTALHFALRFRWLLTINPKLQPVNNDIIILPLYLVEGGDNFPYTDRKL